MRCNTGLKGEAYNFTILRDLLWHTTRLSQALSMKLHADRPEAHTIHAYGEGWIAVNGEKITRSVVLSSSGERAEWPCSRWADVSASHFDRLMVYQPEVVIFGSGSKLRFVHPSMHAGLMAKRVGVETMDSLAACRTYNILAQEGRRVVVALLIEPVEA